MKSIKAPHFDDKVFKNNKIASGLQQKIKKNNLYFLKNAQKQLDSHAYVRGRAKNERLTNF